MIQPASQSPDLTTLERSVLETALSSPRLDAGLFSQISAATVALRTPSGVGFVTKLVVPEECPVADDVAGSVIPVVTGKHPALPSGAQFILQVKNGRIHCIEGFCFEGVWPTDESQFSISVGP